MNINHKNTLVTGFVIAATFFAATSIQAALLVSENYDSKSVGNLIGQDSTLGSTGLSGNYTRNGVDGGQTMNVVAGGLAFSTYSTTSGNSLIATSTAAGGGSNGSGFVAVAGLSLAASHTGTLYSSYLINFSTLSTGAGAASTRITSSSGATSGAARFNLRAEAATNSVITPGVSYGGAATGFSGTNLAIDTTYMVIGRFTNVGTDLSGADGVASLFALTAAQWDSFTLAGSTDAYLDGASVGTGSGQISAMATDTVTAGTFSFANGNFVQTVMSTSKSGTQTYQFDNMLFGTTLADVAVIPEASTILLGVLGALALFLFRRR